eukprot:CAMPEP_0175902406 /NCGR_PEP_ID=MMETSP0108-20121206/3374_1 /TAXON_ID=195067 ORGANISM="Goniomonas pacifica, Strain CCMP1869" /NCGR_SAMPLE_ID=MMETSP0108 /ASSEMBLY_ACC=CAM_ASM_000204 /LENGTH=74 /DNA_ID=CAMNT_0017224045 /DNA_START=222 /DNA_END=446 /DNA_ORIENTATION=-
MNSCTAPLHHEVVLKERKPVHKNCRNDSNQIWLGVLSYPAPDGQHDTLHSLWGFDPQRQVVTNLKEHAGDSRKL